MDEEDIKKRETTLSKKEIKAKEHLDSTFNVVGNLNLHKIKPNKNVKLNIDIENEYQKEREE